MYRKDVNAQSPLRILEQSIHGGLGKGNLGVVVAPAPRAGIVRKAISRAEGPSPTVMWAGGRSTATACRPTRSADSHVAFLVTTVI